MHKPSIIYVTGTPGSGKTTLVKCISERLYIPHVSSDLVHGGVSFTLGEPASGKSSIVFDAIASKAQHQLTAQYL